MECCWSSAAAARELSSSAAALAAAVSSAAALSVAAASRSAASSQGLTLAHFRAQLEDLWDEPLTLELNLSTFGTHPRVDFGHLGDKISLS